MDKLKYIAILLFIVGWLLFLLFINPEDHIAYPKCVFKGLTGLDCPGCGSSRCAYDLVHLEFKAAFQHNPLAFFAIPGLLIYAFAGLFKLKFRLLEQVIPTVLRNNAALIALAVVVLFWLIRNL